MTPTVSIIVPVYNAKKTIARCIESILHQEYTDFEVLLVDDGSADGSGDICDAYALKDPRIQVIHKKNTGVSDTRNTALERARGAYLQFLDSDDWITPDATKLLVRAAETHRCDMVIADFYRVVGDRVSHKGGIDEDSVMTREEFAGHMMENPADFYYGVLWNKLYRRQIVEGHHLRMDTGISWCEDFIFNLEYLLYAQTFFALKAPIYYYVKTKGSLVSQGTTIANTIRTKLRVFEYYQDFYKQVLDEEDYSRKRLQVYRFLLDAAGDSVVLPAILPGSKKLGKERTSACGWAVSGEGMLTDIYRFRKLLDRYLEIAALENDASLSEVRLMLYLSNARQAGSRRELADFTGMSRSALSLALQKLSSREWIRVEEQREHREDSGRSSRPFIDKRLKITFLPASDPVLAKLSAALNDFHSSCLMGLSEEELVQYARLTDKIRQNMRRYLQ